MSLVLFRRRAAGESAAEQGLGARVRKSRQKEASGTADAGLKQIEWSEGEVLKLAGVGTEAKKGPARVWKRESILEDGVMESGK